MIKFYDVWWVKKVLWDQIFYKVEDEVIKNYKLCCDDKIL